MTRIAAAAKHTRAFRASGIRKKDKGFFKQSSPCQKVHGAIRWIILFFHAAIPLWLEFLRWNPFFHYVLIGFAQQSDKLEFVGMPERNTFPRGQCHQLKHMQKRLNMFPVLRIFCSFVLLFTGLRTIWAHRDH